MARKWPIAGCYFEHCTLFIYTSIHQLSIQKLILQVQVGVEPIVQYSTMYMYMYHVHVHVHVIVIYTSIHQFSIHNLILQVAVELVKKCKKPI